MALFEVMDAGLKELPVASFPSLGIHERTDIQRFLRDGIEALGEDLLVIAEEFGSWEDARRRIDLLALDRSGRLVVIELKRTEDGGHMDLQAIRYAAMVSAMELDDVVAAYSTHLASHGAADGGDARSRLEEWLDASQDDGGASISTDVRIVLVSADFGREITTTVLWLNGFEGMDVRCIRLAPYEVDGKVFLDVRQVLPLPEAADYQVRLRRKDAARARSAGKDYTRFHVIVEGEELPDTNKRQTVRTLVEELARRGAGLKAIQAVIPKKLKMVEGRYESEERLRSALLAAGMDPLRWFVDSPLVDERSGNTYIVSNQWGAKTEERLEALAAAFPETKVSFRRADPGAT